MTSSLAMTTSFALHLADIKMRRSSALASGHPTKMGIIVKGSCDGSSQQLPIMSAYGYLTSAEAH